MASCDENRNLKTAFCDEISKVRDAAHERAGRFVLARRDWRAGVYRMADIS